MLLLSPSYFGEEPRYFGEVKDEIVEECEVIVGVLQNFHFLPRTVFVNICLEDRTCRKEIISLLIASLFLLSMNVSNPSLA
jgi:hypothetical protein